MTIGFPDSDDALTIARSDATAAWEVESGQENGGVKSSDVTPLINRFSSLRYTDTDDVGSGEAKSALPRNFRFGVSPANRTRPCSSHRRFA